MLFERSLKPKLFLDFTLNVYSRPRVKPVIVTLVSVISPWRSAKFVPSVLDKTV